MLVLMAFLFVKFHQAFARSFKRRPRSRAHDLISYLWWGGRLYGMASRLKNRFLLFWSPWEYELYPD